MRAYINQVLTSHGDLHTADHEALLLARDGIARELKTMNNLREQITAERAVFATGDMVRTLISASETRMLALNVARDIEHKADLQRIESAEKDAIQKIEKRVAENSAKIGVIESWQANLNGKLAVAVGAVVFGVGAVEFVLKGKFGG